MRFLAVLPLLASMCAPAAQPDANPAEQPEAQPARTSPAATLRNGLLDALEVLRDWDAARARAWARADPAELRALYVHGSEAGRSDVRLLRDYQARGLVVRRLVTQVFAVRVQHRTESSLTLRVFDRVAGGEVVEQGDVVPLRSSRPVTRTITFRLERGAWWVSEISGSGRAPRAARP